MRDPNRIYDFCMELARYWSRVPDWRFGQLIANVLGEELNGRDLFFPEEDEMMGYFKHYFEEAHPNYGLVNNHIKLEGGKVND